MLLTEREVRTGGYCAAEFCFRLFVDQAVGVYGRNKHSQYLLLWPQKRNSLRIAKHPHISSVFVSFKLVFHVVLKHYLLPGNKIHLNSPHSEAYQTLKPFTKQNFLKTYKLKLVERLFRQTLHERSVLLVSDRSGTNQNASARFILVDGPLRNTCHTVVTNKRQQDETCNVLYPPVRTEEAQSVSYLLYGKTLQNSLR